MSGKLQVHKLYTREDSARHRGVTCADAWRIREEGRAADYTGELQKRLSPVSMMAGLHRKFFSKTKWKPLNSSKQILYFREYSGRD